MSDIQIKHMERTVETYSEVDNFQKLLIKTVLIWKISSLVNMSDRTPPSWSKSAASGEN